MGPGAEPREHTRRNYSRPTYGPQVGQLGLAKSGKPHMPWQSLATEVALEVDTDTGLLWYDTVVVTVQRQAGKTKLIGDVADHCCMTTPRARTWFTQQTGKHASTWMREEHFQALADAEQLLGPEGSPGCAYKLNRRAGTEGVQWKRTRSTFYAFPPNPAAMHSKQSDKTFVDEAWYFSQEQGQELRQAIRATFNTRPGAQLWIVSAAGHAGSAYLDEYLARARLAVHDPNSRVCFIDYGIADDEDPEDFDAILRAHPAHGYTINRQAIAAAREDFKKDPAGWARAYGNRPTRARDSVWPEALWTELGQGAIEPPDRIGYAFDVTPLGDACAVSSAWRDGDLATVDHVDSPPVRELPELLIALAHKRGVPIDYDPRSVAALSVVDAVAQLVERDNLRPVELRAVPQNAYAAACVELSRLVFARQLVHFHQDELTQAQANATKSPYADGGFGWARKTSSGSIAALVAATLAIRAFDTLPAAPRKPVVSGGRRR
jgi:hypothetical protein